MHDLKQSYRCPDAISMKRIHRPLLQRACCFPDIYLARLGKVPSEDDYAYRSKFLPLAPTTQRNAKRWSLNNAALWLTDHAGVTTVIVLAILLAFSWALDLFVEAVK